MDKYKNTQTTVSHKEFDCQIYLHSKHKNPKHKHKNLFLKKRILLRQALILKKYAL